MVARVNSQPAETRRGWRRWEYAWIVVNIVVGYGGAPAWADASEDQLPIILNSSVAMAAAERSRPWTIADLVEVRRITSTAIREDSSEIAFVVRQGFIVTDQVRYGLYVTTRQGKEAKKILESSFLEHVEPHPGTHLWTVKADIGNGIQLYDVDSTGTIQPLVTNSQTVLAGAAETVVATEADQGPKRIGIASYQWSPDGRALWYSRYRLRNAEERVAMKRDGIVFDDREMYIHAFMGDPTLIVGVELHVLSMLDHSDRMVAFVPGGLRVGLFFSQENHSASWDEDSQHIRYLLWEENADGSEDMTLWSIDPFNGTGEKLPRELDEVAFHSVQLVDGAGYMAVKRMGDGRHLVQLRESGEIVEDFGKVSFDDVLTGYGIKAWSRKQSRRVVLGVSYPSRHGLIALRGSAIDLSLSRIQENLSECSFTQNADFGVCVRESINQAPELVAVHVEAGTVTALVRTNPTYVDLKPLRTEPAQWVNRFGSTSDGYVTYPRAFKVGQPSPTIVVTHGHDAMNRFAYPGFQWEFPIQVLAEKGYLVLSVNEPSVSRKQPMTTGDRANLSPAVAEKQFTEAFNTIATMESAISWAIKSGLTDPEETGIAGYSRGAEVTEWEMTQSKLFHAAIEGDAGGYPAGHYGTEGTTQRAHLRQVYGGSPFDAAGRAGYEHLSVSFRSKEFAGPFLQLFDKGNGVAGMEIHALLRDAGVPAELVVFPDESHIFWDPRHQASAMQRSIEWFDYWLLGRQNPDPSKLSQYARWDSMASEWKTTRSNVSPKRLDSPVARDPLPRPYLGGQSGEEWP